MLMIFFCQFCDRFRLIWGDFITCSTLIRFLIPSLIQACLTIYSLLSMKTLVEPEEERQTLRQNEWRRRCGCCRTRKWKNGISSLLCVKSTLIDEMKLIKFYFYSLPISSPCVTKARIAPFFANVACSRGRRSNRREAAFQVMRCVLRVFSWRQAPNKVARWQNLTPSFPWMVPGWRAGGTNLGKEGFKFCSIA